MERKFYYTVGLEVHAELKTITKMFCACKNDPDEETPNLNICPVCMAHPGALPVMNKRAVESVIEVGLALGGNIADSTFFDRKNYFYPDIPKGYQISQYKNPIVSGGHLAGFDLTRVHLEEDTANNKHMADYSLIDFNRAGIPLLELVTEPRTFESPPEAAKAAAYFAKELQLLLWYLGASEANMEKGEMRVETNVSVSEAKDILGTKVEVKNLNSFRSVERAVNHEFDRMAGLLDGGKKEEIVQETRGWDEAGQKTFSQRKKESSHDYRYFPDPDLPEMKLHEAFDLSRIKIELPELPEAKRQRYEKNWGIKDEDIETYVNDPGLGAWFEEVASLLQDREKIKIASNYITSDLMGLRRSKPEILLPSAENFSELVDLISENKISSRGAKDILARMAEEDESPVKIARAHNLLQESDEGAVREVAQRVITANPKIAADYRSGKEAALQSLIGQAMKASGGSANPVLLKKILIELLA